MRPIRCPECGHRGHPGTFEVNDDPWRRPLSTKKRFRLYAEALSPSEEDVIALTFEGLRPKQIAFDLGLGVSTVKNYLNIAYCKLGVSGSLELIAKAYREGGLGLWRRS